MGGNQVVHNIVNPALGVPFVLTAPTVVADKNHGIDLGLVIPGSRALAPTEDVVALAQVYIADHLAYSELTRLEIAKAAHICESRLSHLFIDELGVSITDYISSERLKPVKTLLVDTSMPVALVAVKSGYNSASYFVARFKRSTGSTPVEYRRLSKFT